MSNQTKGNLVDISSNTQVLNLYKKRGRIKRIVCIALSVIFLLSASGFVYYYSVLNSMNYVDISNDNDSTDSTLPSSSDVFFAFSTISSIRSSASTTVPSRDFILPSGSSTMP